MFGAKGPHLFFFDERNISSRRQYKQICNVNYNNLVSYLVHFSGLLLLADPRDGGLGVRRQNVRLRVDHA